MNRTIDEILNADFRTAPTPQEVEQWRQERIDLESQLTESQRREELLRAVAKAAQYIDQKGVRLNVGFIISGETAVKLKVALQAAIDGGALKEQELATNGT